MSDTPRKWDDLTTRIWTALGLLLIGGGGVLLGGWPLLLVAAAACGAMFWELVRLTAPEQDRLAAMIAAGAVVVIVSMALPVSFFLLAIVLLGAGGVLLRAHKLTYILYGAVILAGVYALVLTRVLFPAHVAWLIAVVVATDIAGYVFGRMLGGPKFWPRISPKKTWSGTIGGWIAAALVGFAVMPVLGPLAIPVGMVLAFAAQMGDIAESAIKRRAGVKDSSNLLPGHGGFLDRFDGMIAAFALWIVLAPLLVSLPETP